MDFLEKDLEEIIYTADRELLAEKDLVIRGKLKRQLKIGNYGIADLVSFKKVYSEYAYSNGKIKPELEIVVYELKQEKIGISAFLQAVGYVKGIKRYLEKRKFYFDYKISICLIGRTIDSGSTFAYLADILPDHNDGSCFLDCFTYSYHIDGISFKQEYGYSLISEGF